MDRMGRYVTFLARIIKDGLSKGKSEIRGVGVDEHTALLLDVTSGAVSAVGVGTAYICTADEAPAVCEKNTPLTFEGLGCVRLSAPAGDTYSFASWSGAGTPYASSVVKGVFQNAPYGPVVGPYNRTKGFNGRWLID